jgi:hypothetical protein
MVRHTSHTTGARGRDYAAEYARRRHLASERGLTLSQARGHPRTTKGEAAIRTLLQRGETTRAGRAEETLRKYYRVVERLEHGQSKTRALRTEHLGAATFDRYNQMQGTRRNGDEQPLVQPKYHYSPSTGRPSTVKGYKIDNPGSTPILAADGTIISGPSVDARTASLLGQYWNAVEKAQRGDDSDLQKFAHVVVYTRDGKAYRLMTDINNIYRRMDMMSDAEERDFWRTFYSYGGGQVSYGPAA